MFKKILDYVSGDASVAEIKYKEFKAYLDNSEIAELLAYSFLYAINRPNKLANAPLTSDDVPLLAEVNNKCPVPECLRPLTKTSKGKTIKQYAISDIFPAFLDSHKATTFKNALAPAIRLNSNDNKLALCIQCAEEYFVDPELAEYLKYSELKQKYSQNYRLQQTLSQLNLEEEIKDIIDALADYTQQSAILDFNMEALKISAKILPENVLLSRDIQNHVLTYYNYIKNQFAEIDDFVIIQSDIKKAFKQLDNNQLCQEEIVDKLANWILDKSQKPAKHLIACRIIVSFFIQNCEVFHEIT